MVDIERKPIISAIIPVYNGSKYIDNIYHYIIEQDYPNIEIIFIDNNSVDDSINLINELQKKDSRVKLYYEGKQGAGAARNKGVINSKGEFITFFDIDDIYPSNKISSLATILLDNKNVGMVFGKIIRSYENGKKYIPDYDNIEPGIHHPPNLAPQFLHFSVGAGPPAIMCRKDAIIHINGFEGDMLIGEDMAFSFKMAVNHPIYFLPKIVAETYRHSESTLVRYKRENPQLNFYYDQHKHFYLPYIYNNNLFLVSRKLKIIYQYCLKGLINQARIYNYSFLFRIKFLYKEMKYLNKFGLSFCYFPFILIAAFANQYLYRIIKKIFTKIKSYNY